MIGFIIFLYLVIGIICFNKQMKWLEEHDRHFFDDVDKLGFFLYAAYNVLLWFPELLGFIWEIIKNKDYED